MNAARPTNDLSALNGRVVLVRSAQDHHNPPTGRRGTLTVSENTPGRVVELQIDFPQMFTTRAHVRRVQLTEEEIAEMLASEEYGALTVTLKDRLDLEAPPESE